MFLIVLSFLPNQVFANQYWYIPGGQETVDNWNETSQTINDIVDWFKNIKENITTLSIDLMTWTFDLITNVVLHTPTLLFESHWFNHSILIFTGLAIVMVIVLSMLEGFKRMFNKNHTKMDRISMRFPLVILGSGLAPIAFYYVFTFINNITEVIIGVGRIQMSSGIDNFQFNEATLVEVLALIAFDIALISMMIPIFLQNFRRWFDILSLGALTPIVLACWMFKEHEHHLTTWWNHLKKCSMVQIIYAVFLLLLGTLMFGVKEPETELELMIKMGIVIGGLWRMNSPPNILKKYLDTGTDAKGMWEGAGKAVTPHPLIRKGIGLVRGKFILKKK